AQTEATFLKLAGPQLVQMFIGDGAKLVRDCFALAKEKAPAIIFIDELDAVGTKRFDSEKSGDREVQRTMLELLNQLDGFASDDRIKVLAATNRVDVLDPALLRSGRLDRKIEFPLPNEEARAQILKIHSRKMRVDPGVNWGELARSTDEFGGAMLKAVCVEAGMIALRSGKNKIGHEHYVDAIAEVQAKKKDVSVYSANGLSIEQVLTKDDRLSTFTRSFSHRHCTIAICGYSLPFVAKDQDVQIEDDSRDRIVQADKLQTVNVTINAMPSPKLLPDLIDVLTSEGRLLMNGPSALLQAMY
ncbi:hypothetical protein Golomagni_06679, partial [Golovinomyces magnicellulatus]